LYRAVLHCDINNFYASVECLSHPEYRDVPMAVCGDRDKRHGIVLAKNMHAKLMGVKTGEKISDALNKCPDLKIASPHADEYLDFSHAANDIYKRYTNMIEPFGLDESWLDITASTSHFNDSKKIADSIRETIKFELGVTLSIGVSFNKVFAKLGSDMKKPDAITIISPDNYKEVVWPLDIKELLYVGPATKRHLYKMGLHTIGDVAACSPEYLEEYLGKHGRTIHRFAAGLENSPVMPADFHDTVKSVGNSITTPHDITDIQYAKQIIYMLCEKVGQRMREQELCGSILQISIKTTDLKTTEHQYTLAEPVCTTGIIARTALELLDECWDHSTPLRALGVRMCNVESASQYRQRTLFSSQIDREESLDRCLDVLRCRFGSKIIGRAVAMPAYEEKKKKAIGLDSLAFFKDVL